LLYPCIKKTVYLEGDKGRLVEKLNNNIPYNRCGKTVQSDTFLGSLLIQWTNIVQGIELKK
jgi:hypothetical protein